MQSAMLEDLTWVEAKAAIGAGMPVVIPIGASAKQHGRHLPLRTDATIAAGLARRVAERVPVLVAPLVPFGHDPAFVRFAVSQSLSAATFAALVRELCAGFVAQGASRIALLNTCHASEAPISTVLGELHAAGVAQVVAAHLRLLGRAADAWLDDRDGGHADERETSMMLALDGRAVRLDRLPDRVANRDAGDVFSPTGAFGDATRATAYKGQKVLEAIVDDIVAGLRRAFADAPGFAPPAVGGDQSAAR